MWVSFSTNVSLTCEVVESNAPIVVNNFSFGVHVGCAEVEHNICTGNTKNNIYSHFVQKLGKEVSATELVSDDEKWRGVSARCDGCMNFSKNIRYGD